MARQMAKPVLRRVMLMFAVGGRLPALCLVPMMSNVRAVGVGRLAQP